MVTSEATSLKPLKWSEWVLSLLDQTRLPAEEVWLEISDYREITHLGGTCIAAEGVAALNPAFDVTSSKYVTAIVTEQKVLRAPYGPAIAATMEALRG